MKYSAILALPVICHNCQTGKFYALNVADGSVKWTSFAEGERKFGAKGIHGMQPKDQFMTDDWDFFNSSPTIHNDKVYFGSGNGKIYSLDLETGNEVWSFQTGEVSHAFLAECAFFCCHCQSDFS